LTKIRMGYAEAFTEDFNEVTERSIPAGDMISYHYQMAARKIKKTDQVFDIAGGIGTGANYLADFAAYVLCADIDEAKLERGSALFKRDNLWFSKQNVYKISGNEAQFDVITSMETIEHMERPSDYLLELHRVLKPGGLLILSTPQSALGHIPLTPAHVHEYGLEELRILCSKYFEVEEIIGIKAGTIHFQDDSTGSNTMIFLRKRPNEETHKKLPSDSLLERCVEAIPAIMAGRPIPLIWPLPKPNKALQMINLSGPSPCALKSNTNSSVKP
jgi:2-polyprenyl-3-methyl-5-hydroxy-6-metoxy-1,4-benzoquinol methylase